MSNPTMELLSTSGEYKTPLGRMRRTLTYKSSDMDTSTLEAFGRFHIGFERIALGQRYQVENYTVEGDCIRFTVSRESDMDVLMRKRTQEREKEAKLKTLQKEMYTQLEDLLTNDPATFSRLLGNEVISQKASGRFSNL